MISNKKWQQLLALATTGEKLPNDATLEEKEALIQCLCLNNTFLKKFLKY